MPRYLVERTFAEPLDILISDAGAKEVGAVVGVNTEQGVTWIHSYVADGGGRTYCVYDAPSPEAIRQVAQRNGLPVDSITEVRVLDPYFYIGRGGVSDAS